MKNKFINKIGALCDVIYLHPVSQGKHQDRAAKDLLVTSSPMKRVHLSTEILIDENIREIIRIYEDRN